MKIQIENGQICEKIGQTGTLPFSFTYGGRPFREILPAFRIQEGEPVRTKKTAKRRVTCQNDETGLAVILEVITYDDFPIVDWTLYFQNASDVETSIIEDIQALDVCIAVETGPPAHFRHPVLHHFVGSRPSLNDFEPLETHLPWNNKVSISTKGGRPSCSNMPYFNLENVQTGLFIAIGWPGQWTASFSRISNEQEDYVNIRAGQSKTHFKLLPGENLRGPRIVLLPYNSGYTDCQNIWRRWVRAHNQPELRCGPMKPQFGTCSGGYYEGLRTVATTEIQFLQGYIDHHVKLDNWIQDAGWYPCEKIWIETGIWWEADAQRFPKGIREVSDFCHQNGLGAVVWFEPERVYPGTWIDRNKPEWVIRLKEGDSGLLRLGDDACREWLTDKIDTFMKEQGIDTYRQDFNMEPLPYWEHEDAPDRQGVSEIRHVTGYLAYWDELIRRHPGMYIDTCASGGKRLDIETLKRAVPLLRSDAIFVADSNQSQTYGLSFLVPFQGTGFDAIDEYAVRSIMLPELTIGIDTRRDDLDYATLHRLVGEWRKISGLMLDGDYYPLSGYSLKDNVWMAWQFHVPERGEGFVQAFRRVNCPQKSMTYRLCGLDENEVYILENLDGGTERISGKILMTDGFCLSAETTPKALIYHYRKAG